MPLGVAQEFLYMLQDERRAANRRVLYAVVLIIALAAAAHYLVPPWGAFIHVAAAGVAALAGWQVWKAIGADRAASLRDRWRGWMETADRHQTLAERKARAEDQVPQRRLWWFGFVVGAISIELGLLILAFSPPESVLMRGPAAAFPGLVAGFALGAAVEEASWCAELQGSLDTMIRDGELGTWGAQ